MAKTPTKSPATITMVDDMLRALNMPTYTEVASALCEVLDGEQEHDILEMGMVEADALKVVEIRAAVRSIWRDSNGNLVIQ